MVDLLGTRVVVPGTTRGSGILRYIGPIQGKSGVFGGIELQGPIAASRGKNNGSVDGIQYFDVQQPMSGLFIPWERLRTANGRLPKYEDTIRPLSGYSEDLRTPSPRQKPPSRASRPTSQNQSPQLAQPIMVAKRRVASGDSMGSGARSVAGSRSDLDDLFDRTRSLYDSEAAKREISQLRAIINSKDNDLQERDNILAGLQNTVNELQAVLGDLEQELEQKNHKLAKQKADNDKAREEWRESLQLMMSAQQEAEELYEQQIEELRGNMAASENQGDSERVSELEERIKSLTAENEEIKKLLAEKAPSGAAEDDEKQQELEKSLNRLQQDVTSLEFVVQDSQANVKERDAKIVGLEMELEDLKQKEVDGLLLQVDSLQLTDSKKKIEQLEKQLEEKSEDFEAQKALEKRLEGLQTELDASKQETSKLREELSNGSNKSGSGSEELEKKIEDLTHELKMRPTFEELSELQTSLEEVDLLHQQSLADKDRNLAAMEQEKKQLAEELEKLRLQQSMPKPKEDSYASDDKENTKPVSYVKNETLGIYKPPKPVDPSSGRQNWCGLCERDGHNSLNCPYENDIF